MKRVYVVIVNWNGWKDTIECLESVFALQEVVLRVVVCDNGSGDESLDRIRAWAVGALDAYAPGSPLKERVHRRNPVPLAEYDRQSAENGGDRSVDPELVLIRSGENLGFAGGNNVGLRYALARDDFEYVWLLNNDTVVETSALVQLIERLEASPSAGMCGSTLLRYHAPDRVEACGGGYYCKWIGLSWHIGRLRHADNIPDSGHAERWINYITGASLLVSRRFLKDVGLMCEEYFLYFEEADWAIRARGRYSLAYASDSIVYHKIGASIGTSSDPRRKSLVCDYYNIRNRILFTRRFYPCALVTIYVALCLSIVVRFLCGQWQRAAMICSLMMTGGRDGGFAAMQVHR